MAVKRGVRRAERIHVSYSDEFEAFVAYCVDATYLVGFGDTSDEALGDLEGMLALHDRLVDAGQVWRGRNWEEI